MVEENREMGDKVLQMIKDWDKVPVERRVPKANKLLIDMIDMSKSNSGKVKLAMMLNNQGESQKVIAFLVSMFKKEYQPTVIVMFVKVLQG